MIGAPAPDLYHYIVKAEGPFTGFLQHVVNNLKADVGADMTSVCALRVASAPIASTHVAGSRFGAACQPGQTAMDGYLLVCGSAGTFRYALAEDMPATPPGGFVTRPAWYPPLSDVFRANAPPSCPASGRVTLTHSVMPVDQLGPSTSQGAMIFEHVTPIDHGYIGIKALDKPLAQRTEADYVPVYAPADAEIIEISLLGSARSIRIVMAHGCETYSVIMVLNRLSGVLAHLQDQLQTQGRVTTHINVLAGDKIGEQRDNPLDFAINDGAAWLSGFVAPMSYAAEGWKPFTVDPFPYFTPAVASALESTLRRLTAPRWGTIDQDVQGTAAGNWFLDGTVGYSGRTVAMFQSATQRIMGGPVAGKNAASWSHLALARYWQFPTVWIYSAGWWRDADGDPVQWVLETGEGKPAPAALSPDYGTVVYRLRRVPQSTDPSVFLTTQIMGIVAIQVNEDETLTIEPIPGVEDPSSFTGFSAAKRIYRR